MAHKANYYYSIELIDGKIWRINTATYKDYALDIYKECLNDGKVYIRANVEYTQLGGWLVTFPGETYKLRYSSYEAVMKEYSFEENTNTKWDNKKDKFITLEPTISGLDIGTNIMQFKQIAELILEVYPELKYLFAKMQMGISEEILNNLQYYKLFKMIRMYLGLNQKKQTEFETLIQYGYIELAQNMSLWKMNDSTRKKVMLKLRDLMNTDYKNISLHELQLFTSYNPLNLKIIDWYSLYLWLDTQVLKMNQVEYDKWKYCQKKNISKYDLKDYYDMLDKVGHDMRDPYWLYPNNFEKQREIVNKQLSAMEVAKYSIQQDFLKEVLKPMLKYNANVDGYDIFLSTSAEEWQLTCDTLYQCLLRNGYMRNVVMQEELIVFIWKDGVPQATAQVKYDKTVGQFYGDERGHSEGKDCAPNDEVQKAFYKWLETFKPKKAKFFYDDHVHYYKGFSQSVKGGFHTNVGSMDGANKGSTFMIGQIYDTAFDDETIIQTGSKCVSTEKVFHFCSSITEIAKHYNPKYYAEIKPLGPVVENNGALLSNRIEIVRAIPESELQEIIALENKNVIKELAQRS